VKNYFPRDIGGPKGAAEKLGLKRTTLIAKMGRLGITRPELRYGGGPVRTAVRSAAAPDGGSRDLAVGTQAFSETCLFTREPR